jgi:anti-sigma factor RsiW
MMEHDDFSAEIQIFLDGELATQDEAELLSHLEGCASCRQQMEEAKAQSELLKRARPYQAAPAALREQILEMTRKETAQQQALGPKVIRPVFTRTRSDILQMAVGLAAMLCLIAVGLFTLRHQRVEAKADSFIATALDTYRGIASQSMQLDVRSDSPEVVSAWFAHRVSFPFRMPNAGMASEDRAKYKLVGGRLVTFDGAPAALLAFRMSEQTVGILITSTKQARAVGGKMMYSSGIGFHSTDRDQAHVVTWENQNLTYALVSADPMTGKRSCSTCHDGANSSGSATVDKWSPLNPKAHTSHSDYLYAKNIGMASTY